MSAPALNPQDYYQLDAVALAEAIQLGQLRSDEVLHAAQARLSAIDGRLGATIGDITTQAEEMATCAHDGPLAGVPMVLSDLALDLGAVPTGWGSRYFEQFTPYRDSQLMARYRAAGLVAIAKTKVPELGLGITTEPVATGPCRNPHDLERSVGGVGGAAAALVAAAVVPVGHAVDLFGSLRIAASWTGLVGCKPTRGRTPNGPMAELYGGLGAQHVVTRSLRDSAAVLDASEGWEPGELRYAPPKREAYLLSASRDPQPLRIGVWHSNPAGVTTDHEILAVMDHVTHLLADLGHQVEEAPWIEEPWDFADHFGRVQAVQARGLMDETALREELDYEASEFEALTWAITELAQRSSARDYLESWAVMQQVARSAGRLQAGYDVLITPTCPRLPKTLGVLSGERADLTSFMQAQRKMSAYTLLFNITGQPALSLPIGQARDNLPVGIQLVGRFGDENSLFRLAGQIERAIGFSPPPPLALLPGAP